MKNSINYIIVITLALAFMSCDDYLEKNPDQRTSLDSPEKVGELLVNAYPNNTYQMFCFSMSDNAVDKGPGNTYNRTNEQSYMWDDCTDNDQDTPSAYWNACYEAISHCNLALDFMKTKMTVKEGNASIDKTYAPYYGEALVARAYSHFMLLNLWAKPYNPATSNEDLGIPYVTTSEREVFVVYKRETVAKVYDLIEKDLLEGLKYIDDKAYQSPKYHFNKAAANTFASRFYLYKGNWDKVIEYSNKVVYTNPRGQLRDLKGTYKNMDTKEMLAEYTKASEKANLLLTSTVSNWFFWMQANYRYSMSVNLYNALFKTTFTGGSMVQDIYGSAPNVMILKYPLYEKKSGMNSNTGWYCVMTPVFVVEEALFNRAEAYIMKGNKTEAVADIDSYMSTRDKKYGLVGAITVDKVDSSYPESRANFKLSPFYEIDESNRAILNCIVDLRRKEFFYEGMRWFDIRRFNMPVKHYYRNGDKGIEMLNLTEKDNRKVLQIPVFAQQYGIQPNQR